MLIADALQTYTILSIGDGLVSQVPSIIVSIAAGILVTRSSEEANLGEFVGKQLTIYPRAIAISGFLLLAFSFFLSDTFWPFFTLSMACFVASYLFYKKGQEAEIEEISNDGELHPALPASTQLGNQTAQSEGVLEEPIKQLQGDEANLSPMESAIEQEVFGLEWDTVYWFWPIRKRWRFVRADYGCSYQLCPRNGYASSYHWSA